MSRDGLLIIVTGTEMEASITDNNAKLARRKTLRLLLFIFCNKVSANSLLSNSKYSEICYLCTNQSCHNNSTIVSLSQSTKTNPRSSNLL